MPKIELTPKQKRIGLGLLALAAVIAGIVALANFVINSRALSKSILEPLSESMVEKQIKKDANFAQFYSEASAIREALKTPEDQEKYKDVTYKQLREFLTYYSDDMYCEKVEGEARKQHAVEVMSKVQPKIDEVKQKWEKFIEAHDVTQYLDIQIVEDGYSYSTMYWFGDESQHPGIPFRNIGAQRCSEQLQSNHREL